MNFNLTVSPDFPPERIAAWYVFNTWLQKKLGIAMSFTPHDSFDSQRQAFAADSVDLVYANPYDAATLVREKGFIALAKPAGMPDEVVVAVNAESSAQCVDDLQPGLRIASADGPDVLQMGLIILESADISTKNSSLRTCDSNALVAKDLLRGEADVGIFLERAYNGLSGLTRKNLRPLVTSRIDDIEHHLLLGPRLADRHADLVKALTGMQADAREKAILDDLGIDHWEATEQEDVEFLIDVIDTLI